STSNITISCSAAPPSGTSLAYSNGESGSCDISGSVTGSISGSHTSCGGSYTESWSFTDECGRTSTASRTITVSPAAQATFAAASHIPLPCSAAPPSGTSLAYSNGESGSCDISGTSTGSISG